MASARETLAACRAGGAMLGLETGYRVGELGFDPSRARSPLRIECGQAADEILQLAHMPGQRCWRSRAMASVDRTLVGNPSAVAARRK